MEIITLGMTNLHFKALSYRNNLVAKQFAIGEMSCFMTLMSCFMTLIVFLCLITN